MGQPPGHIFVRKKETIKLHALPDWLVSSVSKQLTMSFQVCFRTWFGDDKSSR